MLLASLGSASIAPKPPANGDLRSATANSNHDALALANAKPAEGAPAEGSTSGQDPDSTSAALSRLDDIFRRQSEAAKAVLAQEDELGSVSSDSTSAESPTD